MWEAELRGCETPNWEAVGGHVGGSARPCEAEVGGCGRPRLKWEAEVGGRGKPK